MGVNATGHLDDFLAGVIAFQWAPTLGGECYSASEEDNMVTFDLRFNGHPPLGVNATLGGGYCLYGFCGCFNGHPPLGVNATDLPSGDPTDWFESFQWAPTLGGECYPVLVGKLREDKPCFNGHPPLGVNATRQTQHGWDGHAH